MEGQRLSWRFVRAPGRITVSFAGHLNEHADFTELRGQLAGPVVFDLADLRRINSAGVHRWIDLVRGMPAVTDLSLVRCPPVFMNQVNLILGMVGAGRVASFYVPYRCEPCGQERLELVHVRDRAPDGLQLPAPGCPECGLTMEIDEDPVRYFAFLDQSPGNRSR